LSIRYPAKNPEQRTYKQFSECITGCYECPCPAILFFHEIEKEGKPVKGEAYNCKKRKKGCNNDVVRGTYRGFVPGGLACHRRIEIYDPDLRKKSESCKKIGEELTGINQYPS
jgi:hypothetical protein